MEEWRAELQRDRARDALLFKRKFCRGLDQTEQAATTGDIEALCQLIEWNKRWLFRDETVSAVFKAEAQKDLDTLKKIGAAVARLAQAKRRSPINQRILDGLREARDSNPDTWQRDIANPKFRETLLNIAVEAGLLPVRVRDSKEEIPLADAKYLTTFLKRHGLL